MDSKTFSHHHCCILHYMSLNIASKDSWCLALCTKLSFLSQPTLTQICVYKFTMHWLFVKIENMTMAGDSVGCWETQRKLQLLAVAMKLRCAILVNTIYSRTATWVKYQNKFGIGSVRPWRKVAALVNEREREKGRHLEDHMVEQAWKAGENLML